MAHILSAEMSRTMLVTYCPHALFLDRDPCSARTARHHTTMQCCQHQLPLKRSLLKVIHHDVSSNHFVFRFCWQVLGFLVSDVHLTELRASYNGKL